MTTYKTPNVYVEEVPTLAPSVVPVATAIPAFIGYTEKAGVANQYRNQPVRISSILDYTTIFGGAKPTELTVTTVTVDGKEQIDEITATNSTLGTPEYLMYYTMRLFFDNGGGACYVVSVGDYQAELSKDDLIAGLEAIAKEDEPTLLLLTDAVNLSRHTDYYDLCQAVLKQCNLLKDRFAIFDVLASDRSLTQAIGSEFRNGIGINDLKYGAAYYPYLQTSLNYHYTEDSVAIETESSDTEVVASTPIGQYSTGENGLLITYNGPESDNPRLKITIGGQTRVAVDEDGALTINVPQAGKTAAEILAVSSSAGKYILATNGDGTDTINTVLDEPLTYASSEEEAATAGDSSTLASLKSDKTELYNSIKTAISAMRVVMPPSGAVAGVYAKTDQERGVWKAPANVGIASVIGPMEKVTNEEQENLNVDSTAGKSINAIRSFTGKGTLIWGARTLAGNDNEWRYVPVRRLFNLIEESVQKATSFAVFESNTAITWLKVKTIITSYLDGLWRQGALAGAAPEQAYFVNVGLGQTMISQDILEGRMIVEIGIAAVRPAEFIILKFSHKLQES